MTIDPATVTRRIDADGATYMTAGELHVLMHHYLLSEPYPSPSRFYDTTIARLRQLGLMKADSHEITKKGHAYVRRLRAIEP